MLIDEKLAREEMSRYTFGQFEVLDEGLEIMVNRAQGGVLIKNLYDNTLLRDTGTCTQLMQKMYIWARNTYPELHIWRILGRGSAYFSDVGDTHWFLGVTRDKISYKQKEMSEEAIAFALQEMNIEIFDPSFNVCGRMMDLEYSVTRAKPQENVIFFPDSRLLEPETVVPLCLDSQGNMYNISVSFELRKLLHIAIQSPRRPMPMWRIEPLISSELDKLVSSEPVPRAFVEKLRNTPVIYTSDVLKPTFTFGVY